MDFGSWKVKCSLSHCYLFTVRSLATLWDPFFQRLLCPKHWLMLCCLIIQRYHYNTDNVVPIIFWCRSIFSQNNFMSLTVCSQTWQQPCPAYFWKGPTSSSIIAFTFWQIPKTLGNSCQTITKSSRRLINGKKVFDVPSHRICHESTQS